MTKRQSSKWADYQLESQKLHNLQLAKQIELMELDCQIKREIVRHERLKNHVTRVKNSTNFGQSGRWKKAKRK
jgi:hypothetical protein